MGRLLVVEDNMQNLELMVYLLEAAGHTVVPAMTGQTGVDAALSDRPDLAVLDLQLPDFSGFEVRRQLRDAYGPGLPAVAVTANAMVGDRDHVLASGFDGYLSKPIDVKSFATAIDAFLPEELRGHPPVPRWSA